MKRLLFLSIFFLFYIIGCKTVKHAAKDVQVQHDIQGTTSQVAPGPVDFSDNSTWILGYFNPVQLTYKPYSEWYVKGYDDYQVSTPVINNLLDINKGGVTIKVVMGTWCPDSRREVPRFMRIMDLLHFPVSGITFIGVDDEKRSPVSDYAGLNIQRVPTFIFYRNNIEAGRIIEKPESSLEQDMVNILTRNEK